MWFLCREYGADTTRFRMSKVSDSYKWDELSNLTDEDMENLLLFYPANKVPAMDVLLALRGGNDVKKLDVFDGSFGFAIGV
jgi:precorrin-2 dehydrogenase/sirohydrochlorin ferrochelatase